MILAIETSVTEASIALCAGGECLYEQSFISDRNHNSGVFKPLARALDVLGKRQLSLVIAGTGPGSYSGSRVGIAAAQGLALAYDCPCIGLSSLAATAEARGKKPCLAIGDARRGLCYVSKINSVGEAEAPELMEVGLLEKYLSSNEGGTIFTLDDPAKLSDALGSGQRRVIHTVPKAMLLIDLWLELGAARRNELLEEPVSPVYLRAPFTSEAKAGHPLLRKS